jgi:hypothetical protein
MINHFDRLILITEKCFDKKLSLQFNDTKDTTWGYISLFKASQTAAKNKTIIFTTIQKFWVTFF